ncbi:uncharacterized protein LOC133914644 [Phragmites australis]|uniref:uncharacterized protein LOC133914644 n=1 Tax=Phragmites australis TaxID=29695 RepID=UPI002D790BC7|nr:uncharacterized protein LOC133914644 [Phragmites australis]
MGVQRSELKVGVEPFHGITPNSSTMPLGQVELLVTFGTPDNFRIERLTFNVVNFKMTYNVILGHPILGKFMTVVHYAYHTLKIPGPKGIITRHIAVKCDKQSLDMAEHLSRAATTSKGMDSKRKKHQATTVEIKDKRLVSLADTSKSNDGAKGETSDNVDNKRGDGVVKAIPLDLSEPAKMIKKQ